LSNPLPREWIERGRAQDRAVRRWRDPVALAEKLELGREQRQLQRLVADLDPEQRAAAIGELVAVEKCSALRPPGFQPTLE
jgi:hypothetical protein